MSKWWSYELSNFLLFSPETYDRMVESYNEAMWPWQLAALLSGVVILYLAATRDKTRLERLPGSTLLALAWIWIAWAFHFERYAPINFAAKWFGVAFIVQGILLVVADLLKGADERENPRAVRASGLAIAVFGLAGLPLLHWLIGRSWSQLEVFGFFADATAIVTLGVLLMRRHNRLLLLIPIAWCVIASATLRALGRSDAAVAVLIAIAVLALEIRATIATRRSHPK